MMTIQERAARANAILNAAKQQIVAEVGLAVVLTTEETQYGEMRQIVPVEKLVKLSGWVPQVPEISASAGDGES